MALLKRGVTYWIDVTVNGYRYRESLETDSLAEARIREKLKITEFQKRTPPKDRLEFGTFDVAKAITLYALAREQEVSPRMVAYWKENAKPLAAFFGIRPLRSLDLNDIHLYRKARLALGRAPKTINGEVSVLAQVLRHARLWYKFEEDYKVLPNTKPPVGQALSVEDQQKLYEVAKANPQWRYAYVAMVLSFFCGLRACEIKGLRWQDVDFEKAKISIRRSKTPAGWRDPSLNSICAEALRSVRLPGLEAGDYVFPWHGRDREVDPARPMTSWRTAWRSLRAAAGLKHVRFHDGRHTALTTLAEAGQPDWVIQAQMGHVSPAMMKVYSHVRRTALNLAAKALEPRFASQTTSQLSRKMSLATGSSGWIRTSNPPVNSRSSGRNRPENLQKTAKNRRDS